MADTTLCRLAITSRAGVPLASGVVEQSADLLGLGAADRSRLGTLTHELVDAILREAFGGADTIDLELEVTRITGALRFVIRDRGAPMDFGRGGYPPRVADLIRLGFADSLDVQYEARQGNRTELTKHLSYTSLASDAEFAAAMAAEPAEEVPLDADGQAIVDIRPMTADDCVGLARLFYRCYGYTAAYASLIYEPERLAEYVSAGRHVATVAVAPSGRIVAHLASTVEDPTAITGRAGYYAVDPSCRRLNIGLRVTMVHIPRLLDMGIIGQFSEAVTVHLGSQKSALHNGGHEVGLMLARQAADLDFQGFEEDQELRKAVVLFYIPLGVTPHRDVHVPPAYRQVVERIYSDAGLDRTVITDSTRDAEGAATETRFTINLRHDTGLAHLTVESYGQDFLAALQQQVAQFLLNRFDLILVYLPLGDPLTSYFGAGLQELGLSFCGVYPEYHDGDVLVLQHLNNVKIDPEQILVASPMGEYLREFALADLHQADNRQAMLSRSRAHMARLFDAIEEP